MMPTLLTVMVSLLMQLLRRYVVSHCFPFCSAHTSDGNGGLGFQTEVQELERTYIQTALLVELSYMSVLLLFFTGNWLLITLFNLSSGQHKLYSARMVIWDVAGQLQGVVFGIFGLFVRGTPLMRVYLRALGARIGERVFWDTHPPVETRALTVEDDVVVEEGAVLFGHVVDHELLQFGPIHVGAGSVINAHSQVQPHTHIGSNVNVGIYTTVMKHEILHDGTSWVGSPMKKA
jgi:acetyltransferase-like isoleucine patch superfamily enzyme